MNDQNIARRGRPMCATIIVSAPKIVRSAHPRRNGLFVQCLYSSPTLSLNNWLGYSFGERPNLQLPIAGAFLLPGEWREWMTVPSGDLWLWAISPATLIAPTANGTVAAAVHESNEE